MWRRPFVWVTGAAGTVALFVVAAMTPSIADPLLDTFREPEAIRVVSVTWMTGPELGPAGYLLPTGATAGDSELKSLLAKPTNTLPDWLARHGAVSVGAVVWQVVLEGRLRTELMVVGLRPVLDQECSPPAPGGTLVEAVSEGVVGQTVFDTDIDSKEPVFVRVDVDAKRKPAFTDTVVKLPKGERNPLLFRANSHGPHCKFRIELTYLVGERRHSMVLAAPGGKAFEVTGHAAYKWVYRPPIVCGKVTRVPGEAWTPTGTKCS